MTDSPVPTNDSERAAPPQAPAATEVGQRERLVAVAAHLPAAAAVAVLFVISIVGFSLFVKGFGTSSNSTTILASASAIAIASLGQLVAVISGGFDLSIGGVIPLSAVIFARLTTTGHSLLLSLLVVVLVGIVVGIVHTILISRFNINALIATLATLSITGGLAYIAANGQTVAVPASAGVLGNTAFSSIPYHVLLAGALIIAMHVVLQRTVFGRRVYMLGGNIEAARLAGVRVVLVGSGVYMIAGVMSALSGVVLASQVLAATGGLGTEITLQTLAAVVLGGAALTGGRGSVPGAVIGVLLLGSVADGLTILRVQSFYQQIVTGAVLLLAVAFSRVQETARQRA